MTGVDHAQDEAPPPIQNNSEPLYNDIQDQLDEHDHDYHDPDYDPAAVEEENENEEKDDEDK